MMKRTLSLLLALVMVAGLLPGSPVRAAEASDQIYIDESVSPDELVESGVVDIPEEETDVPETPQVFDQEEFEFPADNPELSEPDGEMPDPNIDEAHLSEESTLPSDVQNEADSEAVAAQEPEVGSGTLSGSVTHDMTVSYASITGDTEWKASETGDIGVSGATQYIKSDCSIRIIPDESAPLDATQLHINLYQLNINGDYQVRVYLDETAFADYTNLTEVIIHGTGAHTIYVTGGASFTLEGLESCRLVLSGADKDGVAKVTERRLLYLLEVATVNINYVTFRHAPIGAVRGRSGQMNSVTFSNCKFESTCSNKYLLNYSAGNGGAIDFAATTSSVETKVASLTVSDCEFDGNTATGNGGAVNLASDIDVLTISNSTFKNCGAGGYGGAIYVANTTDISITGGEISGNTATGGSGGGAAIIGGSATSVSITDAEVYGNTAGADDADPEHRGSGGGIYLNGTGMKATVSGGSFGAAPDTTDPTKVGNKAFVKWIEKTDADGNVVTDENGNPEYEAHGGVGGGLAAYGAQVTVTDTKVQYNESTYAGGGIGLRNGATLSITNAEVKYNCASSGGGISVSEGYGNTAAQTPAEQNALYISGGSISNNRVVKHERVTASGGAIFAFDSTGVSITGTEISDNTSDIYGGGVYAVACTGVSLTDGELSGNTAGSFGGAIYVSRSADISISGGEITGNTAGGYGGGIWIKDETGIDISISKTQISGNTATGGYGGGVAIGGVSGTSVSITGTEVYGNTAGAVDEDPEHYGTGGGIYLEGTGMTATVSDCSIGIAPDTTDPGKVGNKAIAKWTEKTDADGNVVTDENGNPDYEVHGGVGGGLAVYGVQVTMTGTTVIYNETTYSGGGISMRGGATMSITNADVQYNRSSSGGGISIHNCHGDPSAETVSGRYGLYINGGTISNNRVLEQEYVEAAGGGILQNDAKVRLDGVSITYNTAANVGTDGENVYEGSCYGGGLAAYTNSTLEVFGGVIQYNTARTGGGLALYSGSSATLNPGTEVGAAGVQLSNNTAYGYGAGAYVMRADEEGNVNSLTVNNGTVTNNTAYKSSGGGIAVHTGGTLNIYQSEVSGNRCFPGYVQATDENNAPLYDAEGNPVYVPAKDVDENPEYVEGGPVVYKELDGYGGGIYCFASTANITGCDIHDNTAGRRGGGMYSEDGSTIKVTNITDEDGNVLVQSKIRNNTARDYAGGAGAVGDVATETGATITLEGTLIEYNTTLNNGGGGVYISSLAVCTMDENTLVQHNTANTYGGGIYANILADVRVNGATLTQNKANRSGGGIYVNAGSDVAITGGTISENEAAKNGGGIVAGGTALYGCSTVTVTGGQIMDNVAGRDGGGIHAGGTLKEGEQYSSNVLISGGEITQNTAGNHGGGVCVTSRSNVTITDGDISNNVATVWGGGVMGNSNATVNLEGGTISGNNAAAGGGVGVAANAKVYVKNGTISTNNAQAVKKVDDEGKESSSYGFGGGIYATNSSSIEITGGEITGNKALSVEYTKNSETGETARGGGNGGGIYAAYSAEVIIGSPETTDNGEATQSSSAGKITLNEADLNGGGIYATGLEAAVKDDNGNITGYTYQQSRVTVYGGEISNNKALGAEYTNDKGVTKTSGGVGGGIYATGDIPVNPNVTTENASAIVTVNGGKIISNTANSNGGGIYATVKALVTVDGGQISENTAVSSGGGILATSSSTVMVSGGIIAENTAKTGGGLASMNNAFVTIDGGSITLNEASGNGGGIYTYSKGLLTISNGEITHNTAKVNGGGILATGYESYYANISITGGMISNNTATTGNGGGLYATGADASCAVITITGGEISGNQAASMGGGIYITTKAELTVKGGTVSSNTAVDGAGIATNTRANVTIENGTITQNTSPTGNGGGIHTTGSSTLAITGGQIINNTTQQQNGAGLYATSSSTVNLNGGEITENTADQGDGAGLYVTGSATVNLNGGKIFKNTATLGDGGGLYASEASKVTIEDGEIFENTAKHGGGLMATGEDGKNSTVTINGGKIYKNTVDGSLGGGGMFAGGGAVLTIGGGDIYENTSYRFGGGLYATENSVVTLNGGKIRGNTATDGNGGGVYSAEAATVTLNGGEIFENTANGTVGTRGLGGGIFSGGTSTVVIASGKVYKNQARAGGGVYATGSTGATITVSGGQISENTANTGAGLYATGNTVVTVQGGEIDHNTAKGNGGGIYVGTTENNSPTVYIVKDIENNTVGKIQENTARNGGGIYVGYNGMLNVNGGHIINNQAIVPGSVKSLPETGYQQTTLYGAGGGICVVGDATRGATFILAEGDMAIYGNLAGYSRDDVFSNGLNTSLTVPLVSEMNLSGYEFDAIGWFEDYNTDDTSYAVGLNMISVHNAENKDVKRYRSSLVTERQIIDESYVKGTGNAAAAEYVNKANAYVAMTLGIPAAIHDTVVIDYDLSVNIDLLKNDMIGLTDDIKDEDKTLGMEMPVGILETNDIFYTMSTTVAEGFLHDLTEAADSCIELAFGKANWTADGLLNYIVTDMNMDEDEVFWYAVTDSKCSYYAKVTIVPATTIYYEDNCGFITYGSSTETSAWTEVGTAVNDKTQGQDRPGTSMREDLDADNIYGYDGSYSETADYSMGSAMKTTVSTGNNATADFTFTGTGFDIISRSDSNTGLITVTIYEGSPAQGQAVTDLVQVETLMVDAWYESEGSLYQVPLIKKSGLPYGTYTVRIRAAYGSWADHGQNSGSKSWDFYLDAIRIYDPAGNGGNSQEIQDAYLQDNECWPSYQELRNMFLTQNELTKEPISGTIFIDGDDTPSVSQYKNYGPNNEVYLAKGQSIGFTLNALNYTGGYTSTEFTQELVAAIHIGMRGLTGMGNVTVRAADGTVLTTDLSTTDMYYDITDMMNQVVTITNTGETPIAVSTVKVTHTQQPTATASLTALFTVDTYTAETALTMVAAVNDTAEAPVLTPKYPSLSFEGMICYNVFFDAQNLGDLTGADLGLAVFASEDTEGTVETAMDVITGATVRDGLYVISTNGIPAKNMADVLYFKVFAKLSDGSYVYSDMVSYSAVQYAESALATSDDQNLKALLVAMLNYGAEAQKFFGCNAEDLMNKNLTAADQELLSGATAASLNSVGTADASKIGAYAPNGGFLKKYPAISFEGAFEINYYFEPQSPVEGDLTLCFWNEDTYNAVSELTADNADKTVAMTLENGIYTAVSEPIAAKDLDETVYVAAVYKSEGVTYCSGVLPYSIAAYCQTPPADVQELANAAAIYGCTAKTFFNA